MKKLFPLVFLVLVFATVVFGAPDMSDRIEQLFNTLINMFSKTLGALFGAVSKSPYVWLKVFMALIVGVVIHWFLSHALHDTHSSFDSHSKYINIISFVMALAIVAFTPDSLLRFVFALYGGLIFSAMILVPFVILAHFSWTVDKKTKVHYIFLAIMWFLYLGLVSSLADLGAKSIPEFRGAINDTIKLIISICMTAAFVLLIKDLMMALLSKGASAASTYAPSVGAGAKGLFSKLFERKEWGGGEHFTPSEEGEKLKETVDTAKKAMDVEKTAETEAKTKAEEAKKAAEAAAAAKTPEERKAKEAIAKELMGEAEKAEGVAEKAHAEAEKAEKAAIIAKEAADKKAEEEKKKAGVINELVKEIYPILNKGPKYLIQIKNGPEDQIEVPVSELSSIIHDVKERLNALQSEFTNKSKKETCQEAIGICDILNKKLQDVKSIRTDNDAYLNFMNMYKELLLLVQSLTK